MPQEIDPGPVEGEVLDDSTPEKLRIGPKVWTKTHYFCPHCGSRSIWWQEGVLCYECGSNPFLCASCWKFIDMDLWAEPDEEALARVRMRISRTSPG